MKFTEEFKATANLEITTIIGCPVMCTFCPQVSLIKNYKEQNEDYTKKRRLTFDNFKLMLDKLPEWVDIHFSGLSEPYAIKDCSKMIEYTVKKGHKTCVYTTFVGASKEDIDSLLKVPFDTKYKLVIHLPDDDENFKAKINDRYIEVLGYFLSKEEVLEKMSQGIVEFMTMSPRGEVDSKIKSLIPTRLAPFVGISRAGNLSNEKEKDHKVVKKIDKNGSLYCTAAHELNHNVLLPNGDIVLCCMDYSVEHKLGNLLEGTYESLFTGDGYKEIVSLMSGEKEGRLLCRNCELAGKEPKIKYFLLSTHKNEERQKLAMSTWLKGQNYLFYTDIPKNKRSLSTSNRDDYNSNEEKKINLLNMMRQLPKLLEDIDWIVLCDDDTFINTKKLEQEIKKYNPQHIYGRLISPHDQKELSNPIWDEKFNPFWKKTPKEHFVYASGGAGIVLHKDLLLRMNAFHHGLSPWADFSMALNICQQLGDSEQMVNLYINNDLFHSQPPSEYKGPLDKNFISYHYIKTKEQFFALQEVVESAPE